MTYRLELDDSQTDRPDTSTLRIRVLKGDMQRVVTGPWAAFGLPDPHLVRLLKQVHDEIHAGLVAVDGTAEDHALELDPSEYHLADDRWRKDCAWRRDMGRDLFCSAVHVNDDTASVLHDLGDGEVAHETDLATCQSCEIPDERLLCAAYSHAKTYPKVTMGPGKYGHPERIWSASCWLGQEEVSSPEDCRPGKNHCWHQTVVIEARASAVTDGVRLLEAFDFLDSEWRHLHPGKPLVVPTSLAEAAQLLEPVHNRSEFGDHVVRVGELLQKLKIDGSLFEATTRRGSIERLAQWCEEHSPNGADAVRGLAAVNDLRNSLSHTDPPRLASALDRLGVAYPPESWAEAWQGVMSHTEDCLRELRSAIRTADVV